MNTIDLRSDTVTKPTAAMRAVMAEAEVGDDVFGDDPTVQRLEAVTAERLGKAAGLFAPSGTQANLLALLSHCQRGEEYIVGQQAHTYKYEGGGAAVLGSIQPQPLDFEDDGTLDLEKVAQFVKPDDFHYARTRLLCLENTVGGLALPLPYLNEAATFARDRGLAYHLDGARLFNAVVAQGVSAEEIARPFDSVSVCLSKGLGAPVGSVLCGSRELIEEARRWRKMLGGGMRQSGLLAAAGLHALDHHVERLAEDHANAKFLAEELSTIEGIEVTYAPTQTNMVFVGVGEQGEALHDFLAQRGILIAPGSTVRLVVHLDVDRPALHQVVDAFREHLAHCRPLG